MKMKLKSIKPYVVPNYYRNNADVCSQSEDRVISKCQSKINKESLGRVESKVFRRYPVVSEGKTNLDSFLEILPGQIVGVGSAQNNDVKPVEDKKVGLVDQDLLKQKQAEYRLRFRRLVRLKFENRCRPDMQMRVDWERQQLTSRMTEIVSIRERINHIEETTISAGSGLKNSNDGLIGANESDVFNQGCINQESDDGSGVAKSVYALAKRSLTMVDKSTAKSNHSTWFEQLTKRVCQSYSRVRELAKNWVEWRGFRYDWLA